MSETEKPKPRRPLAIRILREILIGALIVGVFIGAVRLWQSRNLLEADGSMDAPDIALVALDEERTALKAFEGKRVFLHFWATW